MKMNHPIDQKRRGYWANNRQQSRMRKKGYMKLTMFSETIEQGRIHIQASRHVINSNLELETMPEQTSWPRNVPIYCDHCNLQAILYECSECFLQYAEVRQPFAMSRNVRRAAMKAAGMPGFSSTMWTRNVIARLEVCFGQPPSWASILTNITWPLRSQLICSPW